MPKIKLTLEAWKAHVQDNCKDSYSLVVELAILILWESNVNNKQQAADVLSRETLGISGAQAAMAIEFALKHEPNFAMDETMQEVRKQ